MISSFLYLHWELLKIFRISDFTICYTFGKWTQCLKITQKVSFFVATENSVFIVKILCLSCEININKAKNFRAVSREIPTGNSREFPEKSCSRKFPGIISGSREFSGIFYVLRRGNVLNFTIFQMFFFWFRSSFTVEKNTIHAENHWNSSMNCIFLRIGVFLSFYKVSFKVPGNSREFPAWFREIPVPGNENLSGNRPP